MLCGGRYGYFRMLYIHETRGEHVRAVAVVRMRAYLYNRSLPRLLVSLCSAACVIVVGVTTGAVPRYKYSVLVPLTPPIPELSTSWAWHAMYSKLYPKIPASRPSAALRITSTAHVFYVRIAQPRRTLLAAGVPNLTVIRLNWTALVFCGRH